MAKVTRNVKDRKGIIGCSQLGQLLNVSHFGTPYTLYMDYTGQAKPKEFSKEQLESMEMGTFFEDAIAKFGAKKYGVKIKRSNKAWIHPKYPEFICHPDRVVVGLVDGLRVGVECKMVQPYSNGWGDEDSDEVPDDYLLQCQGYMACNVCDVVWLFRMMGNRIKRFIIERDNDLIETIETSVEAFVDAVKEGIKFKPDNYKIVLDEYPSSNGKTIVSDDITQEYYNNYKKQEAEYKKLEKICSDLKSKIALFMKDSEVLISKDGNKLCTFKNQVSNRLDTKIIKSKYPEIAKECTKETVSRVFRFSKIK